MSLIPEGCVGNYWLCIFCSCNLIGPKAKVSLHHFCEIAVNVTIPKRKNCKIAIAVEVLTSVYHLWKRAALRESALSLSPRRITTMSAGKVMVVTARQKGLLKLSLL